MRSRNRLAGSPATATCQPAGGGPSGGRHRKGGGQGRAPGAGGSEVLRQGASAGAPRPSRWGEVGQAAASPRSRQAARHTPTGSFLDELPIWRLVIDAAALPPSPPNDEPD